MSDALKPVLARLAQGESLSEAQAAETFGMIMQGQATSAQIAALLMAMRVRGETVAELTGAVQAMRTHMIGINAPADTIDVCGTGGDGLATLNISTAVTFILAGLGINIAKHGNRALSSRAGGADVLAALGVTVEAPMTRLSAILDEAHCVFLFAPRHHAGLRHAAAARVDLGTRTIFNLTGPMANPARVSRQLIGVYDFKWAEPMAQALHNLGTTRAWIVNGGGLDELSLAAPTDVISLDAGTITRMVVTAEQAGLAPAPISAIIGGDAAYNAAAMMAMFDGQRGAYRDIVLLNAAAALIVAGRVGNLMDGAALAAGALDTGRARAALETLKRASAE
ncbi:MAG: anthranilate phosphoribosyltransferase [Rhodospirillales bacterium 20-60-12]|nr:MAG: anthranilate phosphoribosyltransferase [Rhodospirillales bacterium 20-60-12]HQT68450.1 anthranilate phosphoribosyltransferase [Acetobacteraceae bacterium]